ncbi:MAG: metalloregulator ArsR/SmtB family transcription factor [Myxococcota bacterium]
MRAAERGARASLTDSVGLLQLFADPTRVRLLALLVRHELSVAELVAVTGLAQSRVSTHLKRLREAGLLHDRRLGPSTRYRAHARMPAAAAKLWDVLRAQLADATLEQDAERCEALLTARASDAPWPEAIAGEMERHYSPGRTWEAYAHGLGALLRLGDVLDVGCGDGWSANLLAPRCASYVGLDRSAKVLAAARARLASQTHVRFVQGDMESLPFEAEAFDDVLLFHVLSYAADPALALTEAARVLRPGGRLVVTTLGAHRHAEITAAYGHRNEGFAPPALTRALERAGLRVAECTITSRERKNPGFEVITAVAERPPAADAGGEGDDR